MEMSGVTVISEGPTGPVTGWDYEQMHARLPAWKIQMLLTDVTRQLRLLDGYTSPELVETLDELRATVGVAIKQADQLKAHLGR